MSEIKWIKVMTDMFDNRKIKQIKLATGAHHKEIAKILQHESNFLEFRKL